VELVPVDSDVDEAERVAHQDVPQENQRAEIGFVRDFERQHHDGDAAVAEGLESVFPSVCESFIQTSKN
jgi:hypothetical protein